MSETSDLRDDLSYLPNFCSSEVFLRLLLVIELIAIAFALVAYEQGAFFVQLALISLVMLWIGLTSAALLCWIGHLGWLNSARAASISAISVTGSVTLIVSILSVLLGNMLELTEVSQNMAYVLLRNLSIATILVGLVLRYFYLNHESEQNMQIQAQARLHALQARIRPHFLFNSMNTIASLTHDQPDLAERAIENLSDLFRASLSAETSINLAQEIELTRSYVDLELLRLGKRLRVNWKLPGHQLSVSLPALTLQPLMENAIYHGIEPLPEGGSIDIEVVTRLRSIEIRITNPVVPDQTGRHHTGNQMAVDNIRERLQIAFAGGASMDINETDSRYSVVLTIPYPEDA